MYAVEGSDVDLMKYREYMGPDPTQPPPPSSGGGGGGGGGLARYRSAPTSFFASLLEGGGGGGFSDLLSGGVPYDLQFPAVATAVKEEMAAEQRSQFTGFEDGVYKSSDEMGNNQVQVQLPGKINGLARQSSSPAGFFSSLDNGFSVMSDVGNYRAANGVNMKSIPSTRLNDHANFSSVQSSTSRYMPQIDENVNESIDPDNGHFGSDSTNEFYNPIFQNSSWNESSLSGLKRSRESEDKYSGFNAVDSQSGENRDYPNRLAHHMSLPKTSGEMAAIEKYLQFQQDAVPCKIRAKRGFATHPRSIAERVRRTRISDRMKKLQDLFPNMDKQTNTAEMLDLAVEYIKDLQNQVQTLTGKKAKCTCSK